MSEIATRDLTKVEAEELTTDIQRSLAGLWELIKRAYEGRAWGAMGYESWDQYCKAEFDTGHLRLPREERKEVVASLREAGMSTREIAAATGMSREEARRQVNAGDTNVSGADANVTVSDDKTHTPCGKDWPEEVEDYKPDRRLEPTREFTEEEQERFRELAAGSKDSQRHYENTEHYQVSCQITVPLMEANKSIAASRAALEHVMAAPETLAEMREHAELTLAAINDLISAISDVETQPRHLRAV